MAGTRLRMEGRKDGWKDGRNDGRNGRKKERSVPVAVSIERTNVPLYTSPTTAVAKKQTADTTRRYRRGDISSSSGSPHHAATDLM
jgi:hypothetical protein